MGREIADPYHGEGAGTVVQVGKRRFVKLV
jgi:hypothetical protein